MTSEADTIFALSSGGAPTGVAVVRVSGSKSSAICLKLCGRLPEPRQATYLAVRGKAGDLLDRGLVLYFPGPASFTGEDCLELQVHGSRAVISVLLRELAEFPGCRLAEAGEFSRRAFEFGKLDLVEIEGLSELIHAETEAQRKQALRFSEGGASRRYAQWMENLSFARAMIEAELDFSDEGDIPGSVAEEIWPQLEELLLNMKTALSGLRANEIVRDGFQVVIVGPPNAGKSSLLNFLAKRDVAIVTDVAGTTRDVISVDLDLGGRKIRLVDTAGIRETMDPVELLGIEKAERELEKADLVLHLSADSSRAQLSGPFDAPCIYLRTMDDLQSESLPSDFDLAISTVSGGGIDSLLKRIEAYASLAGDGAEHSVVLNARHEAHIARAMEFIQEALVSKQEGVELAAELLRNASIQLGAIVGFVSADALLGLIFSKFCVGK